VVCRNVGRLCAVWCFHEGFARVVLDRSQINMFAHAGGITSVGTRRRLHLPPVETFDRARADEAWPRAVGSCETVKVRAERDRSYLMKAPITPEID
jgi:hypothetical protein